MSLDRRSEQVQFRDHQEWFGHFLANTDQKEIQQIALLLHLQSKFPYMRERITNPYYHLRLLSVGGGTGRSEAGVAQDIIQVRRLREILDTGGVREDRLDIFYDDPSPQMHEQFQETCEDLDISHFVRRKSRVRFEDPRYKPPDVDLTLGFQMWSYVEGWRGTPFEHNPLIKFAQTVNKRNGIAVLSMQSSEGDLHAVRGKHFPELHRHEDIVAEHVITELERLGINFLTEKATSTTNVESCFQDGVFNPTEVGEGILSFMARKRFRALSPEVQQEIAQDIERLVITNREDSIFSGSYELRFRDTYIFIPGDQDVLARKP